MKDGGAINLATGPEQLTLQFVYKNAQADAPVTVVGKL
jgi:hypothetical protein